MSEEAKVVLVDENVVDFRIKCVELKLEETEIERSIKRQENRLRAEIEFNENCEGRFKEVNNRIISVIQAEIDKIKSEQQYYYTVTAVKGDRTIDYGTVEGIDEALASAEMLSRRLKGYDIKVRKGEEWEDER